VPGLSLATLLAPAGSITLHAAGSIVIEQLTAGGNNGTAEVVSSSGDLRVLAASDSAPVTVHSNIDFRAAGTLRLPAFFTAPGTISYRAEQLIFNDATGSAGAGDGSGIPSVLQADTIVLEQRGGLTLKGISRITANRLELLTDGNLFATDIGTVNVTELVLLARGLKTVTAEIYDGETGGTKRVQQPTGRINLQAVSVSAGTWDVRAPQEQFIELSRSGTTLLTVRGTLSGLVDSPRPQQLTFRASQPLRLQDAILAAETVTLFGASISANAQTEIQATRVSAEAAGSIRLYTASDIVSAVATGPGDVQITNTGAAHGRTGQRTQRHCRPLRQRQSDGRPSHSADGWQRQGRSADFRCQHLRRLHRRRSGRRCQSRSQQSHSQSQRHHPGSSRSTG
jgi:hypothetical protein